MRHAIPLPPVLVGIWLLLWGFIRRPDPIDDESRLAEEAGISPMNIL